MWSMYYAEKQTQKTHRLGPRPCTVQAGGLLSKLGSHLGIPFRILSGFSTSPGFNFYTREVPRGGICASRGDRGHASGVTTGGPNECSILMAAERSWEPCSEAGRMGLTSKCLWDYLALMMRFKLTTGRHFSQWLEQGVGLGCDAYHGDGGAGIYVNLHTHVPVCVHSPHTHGLRELLQAPLTRRTRRSGCPGKRPRCFQTRDSGL